MSALPPILTDLLSRKDSQGIKDYLEGLKATEKGLAFEQFLELVYKGNGYAAVRQGGRGDLGADILLYDPKEEGIYCIIQAKNHSSPLNRDDTAIELNKFETLASKKYGCKEFEIISINGFVASALKMKRWRLNLRDWSYVEKLIENYDPNNPSKPNIRLHSHNQTTFDSAIESLHEGSRVACIQATGTGKSYVIAKTMNEFSDRKKLVIAPSHHILKQQKDVVPWLKPSTQFMTYAGARNLEESELKELNPELIVLDEFHRAGAEAWGSGVDRILKNCPDAKVLGTTATPIRYLDGERDMSDELFDEEAVNLPLAEAIQRNILPSPEYVASLYTLNEEADNLLESLSNSALSDDEKKTVKAELGQAKIDWEKTSGVPQILKKYLSENLNNKFIVFCKNKEHLDELEDEVRKWIRKTKLFDYRKTYRVHSDYSESDANLEAFLEAKDRNTAHILLSIDMLNEGIHAPDVGAVLLFRPTESPRIFYQQIGRCLQVGTNSKPIIFDFVNNFQSIRAGDFLNDLQEAGETERELREEFGLSADYLPEILVHDESRAILETFDEIDERLTSWEVSFQKLVAYKQKHGDCLVPDKWKEDKKFSSWVGTQRGLKRKGMLSAYKTKRLDELGFVWEVLQRQWEFQFQKLVAYIQEYGDCLIPRSWKDRAFSSWVGTQRGLKRKGMLSAYKTKRLDDIGFVWDLLQHEWEIQFQAIIAYKEEHGNCLVPAKWSNNKKLANWVGNQRQFKRKGILDADKEQRLEKIGFIWEPDQHEWEIQFQALIAYKRENGDCLVPIRGEDKKLGSWVNKQRNKKKLGKLNSDKTKRLNEIGFIWNARSKKLDRWEEQFKKLLAYKEEHGDCLVTIGWKDKQLSGWIKVQRQTKQSGKLSADRIKRLDELDFVWDPLQESWDAQFKSLVAYKQEHGDCLVKRGWKDNKLARWVLKQRQRKRNGKLGADTIRRLDSLGFSWDPDEDAWEFQFQKLLAYKQKNGNCLVPAKYNVDKVLGAWVGTQRDAQKKGNLDPEKTSRLNDLGFVWDVTQEAWDENFLNLDAYKKQHGNCLVRRSWKDNKLAKWVGFQRQAKRNNQLDADKIKRLDELGFVWSPDEQAWEAQFQKLLSYKEKKGDCLVPHRLENKALATWVTTQRSSKKKGTLRADKIKRLDEIGFVWDATK
ncbi:Helicase associated domain protein [Akkermansiaceae bacterium]|nr:Helicase associated domain protein [Akkermansiaceae bacterium]